MYYDQHGRRITLEEWMVAMENSTQRLIARTVVGFGAGKKLVSTIWIGLDMNMYNGHPLIFETMLFRKQGGSLGPCRRYATKHEAVDGHDVFVDTYRYNRRQRRRFLARISE